MKPIPNCPRYYMTFCGKLYSEKTKRFLSPAFDKKKYKLVGLYVNGGLKSFKLHRLVAITWIPNPENKPEVNHKFGKENNCVYALEWVTGKENVRHAVENNLRKNMYGSKNPASKKILDPDSGKVFDSIRDAAKYFNLSESHISAMMNGRKKNNRNLKFM